MAKPTLEVSEALTRQVAELARLELSDEEAKTFTTQIGDILKYVADLQTLDLSSIEPMTHPLELPTALREDTIQPSPVDAEGKPKVLSSAPEVLYDGYKVPPIL